MIALLVLVALLIAALEWNRRRQRSPAIPAGSRTGVPDRDLQRLRDDLRAAADRACSSW
ncbi:hypothetical protein Kfla_0604 [Kribbella flavida DSM 17836]|uniref:Uncharacterized protein n=1 Tax=Kribbella flavida (strain DSM 17836 / JCM 10339 / NBRC 14399) TaxID=479435 RepID=D2PX77_KRIFD|nr:hypothetical protein [Kribbella flavida]ADB29725.1 hypothetical protein Kfla_0604 [Kribbella flavida DSM 17836]